MREPGAGSTTDDDDRDEVEALADDFVSRRRRGERPRIEEYADRCPGGADEIRELFPAIAAMERYKPRASPRRSGPKPGDFLGDYRIVREIGRGGMGIALEAEGRSIRARRPRFPEGIRRWASANRSGVAAMAGGWAVIATMVGSIFVYRYLHPPFPPPRPGDRPPPGAGPRGWPPPPRPGFPGGPPPPFPPPR